MRRMFDLVHDLVQTPNVNVTIHEAKTHLSRLLRRVEAGEEVVILRGDRPVARLVPVSPPSEARRLGRDRGKVEIAEDFDEPLPEELLAAFEGG